MAKKKWLMSLVGLLLLITMSGCQKQSASSAESEIPTVLIHGAPGSDDSFTKTMDLLKEETTITEEPLMEVTSDGRLIVHGIWKKGKHPVVLVRFNDSNADEDKRSEWLANCLKYLKRELNVNRVNLVGHSMGGIDIFYYATRYQYNHPGLPSVNRAVAIGAPFNGCDFSENGNAQKAAKEGPAKESREYKTYAALAKKHPIKVGAWLNIAGDKLANGEGDLIVPLSSVSCIEPIMKEDHVNYTYQVFNGDEHSELHDDKKVIQSIVKFLWKN